MIPGCLPKQAEFGGAGRHSAVRACKNTVRSKIHFCPKLCDRVPVRRVINLKKKKKTDGLEVREDSITENSITEDSLTENSLTENSLIEDSIKKYSIIKNMFYCYKCTAEYYPLLLLWCILGVLIGVILPVLTMYLPKTVIDEINSGESVGRLIGIVLAYTLSIALLTGGKRLMERFIDQHRFKMHSYYIRKIAQKGMTTDYCNQEKEQFRRLQTESFQSCSGHYSNISRVYETSVAMFSNLFGFAVYSGILAKLSPFVVLFLAAVSLISYVLNRGITKWAAAHNKEKTAYSQKINYINTVSGDIKSAKDIRLYRMSEWLETLYHTNIRGLSGWYKRYTAKLLKAGIGDGGLSLLRDIMAYAYLLSLVLNERISVSDFVLYFGAITGFSIWLSGILGQTNDLNRISLSVNYVRAYLTYPEHYKNREGTDAAFSSDLPKTITLKNVCYRYEGAGEDTLKNFNLTINPGEHLAVVGLNGAGKTTLVKLICGLCDPTEGAVYYDGRDVREYNRRSYYKLFSAVFQQFSILPVTIEEIVAESTSENVNCEKVKSCLIQAGLWDKIASLPGGMKSNFSKEIYDDGVEFSGGEMQKLVLARALYKDAPVMILDEPTAALDPLSESRLYELYHDMMKEKSTVFISHRLASTRFCDRIILIENGTVCEQGTHDSLLAKQGRYYDLFETQAKYYRENSDQADGLKEGE